MSIHVVKQRPLFEFLGEHEFLGEQMDAQLSSRDYAHAQGEAVVKALLLGYLGQKPLPRVPQRGRTGQGLEPMTGRHPHLRWGYLIELKYLKRDEKADEARVESLARQAREQLRHYLADERLARQYPQIRFVGLALVFHGWKLVRSEAVTVDAALTPERAARPTSAVPDGT